MLTALPLIVLLVQAEPAPAAPAPAEPVPTEAAPASAAPPPAATPARPAPPAPLMPEREALPPPAAAIGLAAGISYRLPPSGRDVPPALGFTVSTFARYRYALIADRLALGVMAAFGYHRHSTSFQSLAPANATYVRELSSGDFAALQSVALLLGRVRPWLAAGVGVSLGHFKNPENPAQPDEERETLGIVEGQGGIDFELRPQVVLGLQTELLLPLARPVLHTDSGAAIRVFGPRLAVRLSFEYRF